MQPVPLNAFQQVMRLWDTLHPYNAAHAIELTEPQPIERLRSTWHDTLEALQLGRVRVRGSTYTHDAANRDDPSVDLHIADASMSLAELLTQQMNRRFSGDDYSPFQAFVLTRNNRQFVGVTYHHWTADSFSIRRLLHQWFARLFDPDAILEKPHSVAKRGLWHHFGPDRAGWRLDDAIGGLLRYVTRFTRARRCPVPMGDLSVEVTTHALPDGLVPHIARRAKSWGVTVNDVLVATMLQTLDELGVHPPCAGRDELLVSTVADLRGSVRAHAVAASSDAGSEVRRRPGTLPLDPSLRSTSDPASARIEKSSSIDDFGLFLGFTTTLARPADLKSFPLLLQRVAAQSRHHKRTSAAAASTLRMGVGLLESKLTTTRKWAAGYRERMPLAATISNVNLNRDWPGAYHPNRIRNYFRVTPTGPMIPITFTPTSLGESMNFCLTRQTALIDAGRNALIAENITRRLIDFAAE